ncbi:MAG: conserved phage C-terminal domain-containing protein [Plesiomonas sp.]
MHYYKFNIADWAKETGHLSLKEEAILLRLINWYLDYESPIPVKTQMVLRKLRLADESDAVDMLLNEFFTKTQDGWRMKKLDKTVDEYQAKAERNRKNGKSGGRPKNNDLAKPTGLSVDSEKEPSGNLNQEPITNNQEPRTNNDNKEIISSANDDAISVLTYLNEVCGTRYSSSTKSHIQNISARLKDHSVEDLKLVIDHKSKEWSSDSRMAAYLRPQTLFGTGKFEGYLMAAKAKPKQDRHNLSGITYTTGSF